MDYSGGISGCGVYGVIVGGDAGVVDADSEISGEGCKSSE